MDGNGKCFNKLKLETLSHIVLAQVSQQSCHDGGEELIS